MTRWAHRLNVSRQTGRDYTPPWRTRTAWIVLFQGGRLVKAWRWINGGGSKERIWP